MGTSSFGRPIGTAQIGNDDDAVVDSELRVRGVRGLRVADASVMPSIVSGATNAASIMIGGRAAEFITAVRDGEPDRSRRYLAAIAKQV
jgi:choline dehydrogenase